MPSESIVPPPPLPAPGITSGGTIKCSHCGGIGLPPAYPADNLENAFDDDAERMCAACWTIEEDGDERLQRDLDSVQQERDAVDILGLGLRGMDVDPERHSRLSDDQDQGLSAEPARSPLHSSQLYSDPLPIPSPPSDPYPTSPTPHSHSLPAQYTRPWNTHQVAAGRVSPISEERGPSPSLSSSRTVESDRPYNPLLDITSTRMSNLGRGALYPGAVFKGTQTSGRSAYDVEIRFIDVNFPESSVSGYLSISHLTDTHPHLTTFFTGEIIGPKYGFITGSRFGATEHDDMRHWGRFEQFRRPATRQDMIRPDLLFREPVARPVQTVGMGGIGVAMDKERGVGMERDFVFLRIKERFLVPDHTVRDISGASFAGFYFAMIDLNPTAASAEPLSPTSPTMPKSPPLPQSPVLPTTSSSQYFPLPTTQRRLSTGPPSLQPGYVLPPPTARRMSNNGPRSPGWEIGPGVGGSGNRRRRESNSRVDREPQREATMRGYYFHSLNQEPFQELFLTHIPNRSSGIFEMR